MKNQTHLSDKEIVLMYNDGDSKALTTLFNRYKEQIFTSIYRLVKDKYLSEDICQDVFIRIIKTLNGGPYTDEGKFLPWAIRIARNLCLDYFRKIKRTPTNDNKDISEVFNLSESDFYNRIIAEQTSDKIRKLIDLLPEDQRDVIILRHYKNLSFNKIAELTGCSNNTATGRMRYGLLNMRKIIKEKNIIL